jgi:hypothetical protein
VKDVSGQSADEVLASVETLEGQSAQLNAAYGQGGLGIGAFAK